MSKFIGDVSAYAYAVSKGYTGTEEEFAELMADYANVGQRAEDAADRAEAALDEFTSVTADATTLPEGSSATAEYSDGHLTLGIPKGDKGDTGATGDGAVYAVIGNMASVIPAGTDGYLERAYTITIPVTFYSGKDNVTGSVTSSDLYISRTSGGSGEMDTVPGSKYRNVKTATIIYAIPAGWKVGNGRITLTVTIGTVTLTYYHAYTTAPTGPQGEQGIQGPIGATPNLTIGTVTTLQPTAPATATITGTADNPVLSFGIPKGDTGEVSQDQFDAALALKADAIGNYPELAVGTAEQIDSDTVVSEDVAPYQFRQSISGASNRAYDQIVGGSLAVNQIFRASPERTITGITVTHDDAWETQTINGTAAGIAYIATSTSHSVPDHVYFVDDGFPESMDSASTGVYFYNDGGGITTTLRRKVVAKATANNTFYFRVGNGFTLDNVTTRPTVVDLTAMFGTTIADYVYSLETATAGAGVAWLKAHFPRIFDAGYIPYNTGELVSVQASAHKMTGFNQWDEEWELGYYNRANGNKDGSSNTTYFRSKNFIPCLPNTAYHFKTPTVHASSSMYFSVLWYDADKNYLYAITDISSNPTRTTPSNAYYMTFYVEVGTSGATYQNDICINISSSRNGTYEPYEAHSYPLDDSLELRGLPKLDADNNLFYDGDVYESTGKVTRKYGIVDLGTLSYVYETSTSYVHFMVPPNGFPKSPKFKGGLICTKYIGTTKSYNTIDNLEMCVDNSEATPVFRVRDDSYTDAATFKAAMSGVYLVYELATPTTDSAQPFTNPQVVDASGAEEYVTDSVVPVGHVTKYVENLKAKLENAPASPTEDGDYIVRQTDGVNEYVPLEDAPAITAKADVTDLLKAFPTDTASGAVASFTDGAELPLKSLVVDIEPIQDLHGYDNPWPAGGGKNLLYVPAARTYTENGVTWTLNQNGSIAVNGTATEASTFRYILQETVEDFNGDYYFQCFPVISTSAFQGGVQIGGVWFSIYASARTALTGISGKIQQLWFQVKAGQTLNTTFYPMIYKASETITEWSPYENICPISGHTQAVVTRTGVNVWDEEWESGNYDANGLPVVNASTIRSKNFIPVLSDTVYFMKTPSGQNRICFYDANKNFITRSDLRRADTEFTTIAGCRYIKFHIDGTTYNHDISINYPATDTDYHEGHVQSITIALGQTVYGGTLDVTNGVLTIDNGHKNKDNVRKEIYTLNGHSVWLMEYETASIGSNEVSAISSVLKQGDYNGIYAGQSNIVAQNSQGRLVAIVDGISSVSDIDTWLNANPDFLVVYKLATPLTIQLDPHEVTALLGSNNIWPDAGEVTAEYRADPTLFIQRKIAEALS